MAKADKGQERKKRTITEIRQSKTTGEKMVYMSVPDDTSAQWAEMAGVDVAVVGDSLAMIAHGHPNTIPASMDMMVLHSQAVRRGAPNTFARLTGGAVGGVKQYVDEVKSGAFPDDDHTYSVKDEEYDKFLTLVETRKQV